MNHSVDWNEMLTTICDKSSRALRWGFPEPWIQTELFAALEARSDTSGWAPFPMEIPYVTFGPVKPPKPERRDWRTDGAVKWIDLCLRSKLENAWWWIEVKARHIGVDERRKNAALEARDVVRKDVVALAALDVARTATLWREPDWYTNAYWMEKSLAPLSVELSKGKHVFSVVYVQLGGALDSDVWAGGAIEAAVNGWWSTRIGSLSIPREYKGFQSVERNDLPDSHSALVISGAL